MSAQQPGIPPLYASEPHQARQVAESFGSDAERYDRARPSYPSAMIERIVANSPGLDVLDVGTGTGISARQFQAVGCRVLGVEVDPRMAELARRSGVDVEVGAFETWSATGRTFDAVVAGQAWHWVDPVAGAAKAAEVLRPGGRLAMFWSAFQPPHEMEEAFTAVYRRVLPDSPFSRGTPGLRGYAGFFAKAAEGIRSAQHFGPAEQWQFDWERTYARDEWLDAVPTFGGYSALPTDTLDELLTGIGAAIDASGGSFTMAYATVVVTATRNGDGS